MVSTNTTQAATRFYTQLLPVSHRGEQAGRLTTPRLPCCPPSTGRGGCRCPAGPACEEEKRSLTVQGPRPERSERSPWLVETGGAVPTRKGLSGTCSRVKAPRVPGQTHPQPPAQAGDCVHEPGALSACEPADGEGGCPVGSGLRLSASPGLGEPHGLAGRNLSRSSAAGVVGGQHFTQCVKSITSKNDTGLSGPEEAEACRGTEDTSGRVLPHRAPQSARPAGSTALPARRLRTITTRIFLKTVTRPHDSSCCVQLLNPTLTWVLSQDPRAPSHGGEGASFPTHRTSVVSPVLAELRHVFWIKCPPLYKQMEERARSAAGTLRPRPHCAGPYFERVSAPSSFNLTASKAQNRRLFF